MRQITGAKMTGAYLGSQVCLAVLLLCFTAVAAQSNDIDTSSGRFDEPTLEDIKDLTKANGLDLGASFRCGLFFAGAPGEKPFQKLFILPKLFPTECPAASQTKFRGFCSAIFDKIIARVDYESPSVNKTRKANGFLIGDDICGLLQRDHKIFNVGWANKKGAIKYEGGLKIGFYWNSCATKKWWDTEKRFPEGPICCKFDPSTKQSKFKRCPGQVWKPLGFGALKV